MRGILVALVSIALMACGSTLEEEANTVTDPLGAAKTRLSLGLSYLQAGNFSQAKFNLDRALSFAPRYADAHFGLAYYYQQVGEIKLARASYDTALGLAPNDPEISNSYGAFLCLQGEYDAAEQRFLAAVNARDFIAAAETYENAAVCQQSKGDILEAIFYLKKSLNHQPRRVTVLALLAELQASQSQYEDAKATLERWEAVTGITADSVFLRYQIAQSQSDRMLAKRYAQTLRERFAQHPNAQKVSLDEAVIDNTQASQHRSPENPKNEVDTNDVIVHELKSGETLYRLSLKYNVSVDQLIKWNNLVNISRLSIGQKIIVSQP
jgi:type IV pilus assembly protein PilF